MRPRGTGPEGIFDLGVSEALRAASGLVWVPDRVVLLLPS